jgi:manganese transport protein
VLFTRRADVMGVLVNRRLTSALAWLAAALILALNGYLLYQLMAGG